MYPLKPLHKDALPAALAKAERYRLLNEAREAESICRDILAVDPEGEEAKILLVLALSDQLPHRAAGVWAEAIVLVDALGSAHARAYYRGILHERRAKARMKAGTVGSKYGAHDDLRHAMECFEEAASSAPAGDDSALLRWNTCARILNADPSLAAAPESSAGTMLE